MVLTDLPFQRGPLIHSRYDSIRRSESAPSPSKDQSSADSGNKEYAAFLKRQERKVGPDGFLDSSRYSHTFQLKKERETKAGGAGREGGDSTPRPSLLLHLTARAQQDDKDYQRRLKVVEDHMWQHKQEERELKRVEGDIIKNQRAVRHALRDFGTVINRKRMAEDKKLNQSLDKFSNMQREHTHKKHEIASERARENIHTAQMDKVQSRKVDLRKNDLARQYQEKLSALELKRAEVMRLSEDFQSRIRNKEDEQHRLKNELGELAITLNMVAHKGRVQRVENDRNQKKDETQQIQTDIESTRNLEHKLQRSDGEVKAAELTKRRLSAELSLTKAHLDIRKRDEQRHLTDTQIRLADNGTGQRQLNEAARLAQVDLQAKHMDQKVQKHTAKRARRLETRVRSVREKEEAQQEVWEARFKARALEAQRAKHTDHLNFFTKLVSKDEEREQRLFSRVRESEYARQQREQELRRLQQRLNSLRARNKQRLTSEHLHSEQAERDLEQQILRHKAQLDQVHAAREESYVRLQNHRQRMKEDQHVLHEHQREHHRLQSIAAKSEPGPDQY